jgi:TonB family protein
MAPTPPGGARRPTDRRDDPDHAEGHKAKYPGPDASRDEYLAYLVTLTNAQLRSLPPQLSQVRDGAALYEVLIRPNGSIVWFSLIKSSGHPDVDSAVTATLNGIQAFPPLPNELLEPGGGPIKLTYTMPLARLADLISGR